MTKIIGITGGIASGKSSVVAYVRKSGYQVIDADAVVHKLQKRGGQLYLALLDFFGSEILDERLELNRAKLGQMIFSSPEMLEQSAQLQNRIIKEALKAEKEKLSQTEPLFFMDIPLLYEQGYQEWCDVVWLLDVTEDKQVARLMARNKLSYEEAQKRIAAQMSLMEKKAFHPILIDNNSSLENLFSQVQFLIDKERG